MALQTPVLSPATPAVMAESALYRQRLEVIAEKRRLQEEIGAARRELEEEKLRVERLKRKSLRERWLMDGAAEGPERPEDPASKDPQSPEGQAQARIRNLEDSLFSLQSQLQLLQSASTGAQHRPAGRPAWRREGPRPLSQPSMEAGPAGLMDADKRTSLPAGPVGMSPESPSDPREESIGVLPALRPSPEAIGDSSEANGPCSGHSPVPEQLSPGASSVTKAKGDGVVEVVWAGLRATENSATGPTDVELEAKVEEVVLEAIGARQDSSSPELPAWVKEGRGVVEVVWEGLGGSDPDITGESGRGPEATHSRSPKLQEQSEAEMSRKEEDASRDSPEGVGQGGPGGEEGSFIWVERVALSEDWEELLMEGLEAPPGVECAGGPAALMGAQPREGGASWEVERREVEKSEDIEERGKVEKLRAEKDGAETPGREESQAEKEERKDGGDLLPAEVATDEEKWEVKRKEEEEPLEVEKGSEEEPATTEKALVVEKKAEGSPEPERKRSEKPLDQERDGESPLDREPKTTEILLDGETEGESSLDEETKGSKLLDERTGGEDSLDEETKGPKKLLDEGTGGEGSLDEETKGSKKLLDEGTGGEGSLDEETKGSKLLDREAEGTEPSSEAEKTSGSKEEASPEEQGKSSKGAELPVEDSSQPGAALRVQEEPTTEEQGLQGPEEQEGPAEEAARKPQPTAESEEPPGDATPLLAETPGPEQPAEGQPLLREEVSGTNLGDHPAPTYAPARQLELAEAKEGGGPKQKTCQCCVVM
ncbi:paralemmin-3 [Acomys russatus]|uniref:paralemmin-3 n=1 Tax=Acomys russatus TaxID=60746 RepID=UPI0021E243A3|nr:paralemmin-3 [Acomys russatus]